MGLDLPHSRPRRPAEAGSHRSAVRSSANTGVVPRHQNLTLISITFGCRSFRGQHPVVQQTWEVLGCILFQQPAKVAE